MSRIPWARYSGDDIEAVIAVMLCSQNPRATLIRPASGDGGLDVIVPTGVDGVYDVYQVKKFASNLTNTQKRQIQKSLDSVHKTHQSGEVKVRNWYLTMPLDPTNANLAWLRKQSNAVPFNTEWRGLTFVDSLAAAYPNVVDYYLRDSKDRLQSTVRDLALLKNIETAGEAIVGIDDLRDALGSIQSLTDTDPHFRYAIHLAPSESQADDAALFTTTWHQPQLDTWFSVGVYPRFEEALQFRPVTMNFFFTVPPDAPQRVEFDRWRMYGKPFTAGPELVQVSADLPFGLGWEKGSGTLSLRGQRVTDDQQLKVIISTGDDCDHTSLVVNIIERAAASDSKGAWLRGTDDAEILNIELLIREDEGIQFSFTPGLLTGKEPRRVLPTLRFVADLHRATHMAVGKTYGPPPALSPLDTNAADGPNGIDHDLIADYVEALARLQEHIPVKVLIPDFNDIKTRDARDHIHFGKLLDNQVVEANNALRICGKTGLEADPAPRQAAAMTAFSVEWEGSDYPLGNLYIYGSEVILASAGEHEGHTDWLATPVGPKPWLHTLNPNLLSVAPELLPASWLDDERH